MGGDRVSGTVSSCAFVIIWSFHGLCCSTLQPLLNFEVPDMFWFSAVITLQKPAFLAYNQNCMLIYRRHWRFSMCVSLTRNLCGFSVINGRICYVSCLSPLYLFLVLGAGKRLTLVLWQRRVPRTRVHWLDRSFRECADDTSVEWGFRSRCGSDFSVACGSGMLVRRVRNGNNEQWRSLLGFIWCSGRFFAKWWGWPAWPW